jgi:hypothetical protein
VVGGCNHTGRYAIDGTQLGYKSILAAIIAVFHAQTPVTVADSQLCNAFSNSIEGEECDGCEYERVRWQRPM